MLPGKNDNKSPSSQLLDAAANNQFGTVKSLLEQGANPNQIRSFGDCYSHSYGRTIPGEYTTARATASKIVA